MRARVVAAGAVLAAVAAVASAAWMRTLPGAQETPVAVGNGKDLTSGLLAVAWTATGAVLVALRPRNALGWLLVVVGLSQAAQQGLAAYGGYGVAMADPPWPLATWAALVAAGLWLPGLAPLFNLLPALYPKGRLASRWWRWPVGAAAAGIVLMTVALILSPGGYDDVAPGRPPITSPTVSAVCFIAGAPLLIAGTLVIWGGSVVRLVRAQSPERQQLAWLLVVIIPWVSALLSRWRQPAVRVVRVTAAGGDRGRGAALPAARHRAGGPPRPGLRGPDRRRDWRLPAGHHRGRGPAWTGARCLE